MGRSVRHFQTTPSGMLEQFEKRLLAGKLRVDGKLAKAGGELRNVVIDDWIVSVNTSQNTWKVFHLEYNPARAARMEQASAKK
jgi:hypothetical protein